MTFTYFLPLIFHELLERSSHLFSFSIYGHPSGNIEELFDQIKIVTRLENSI